MACHGSERLSRLAPLPASVQQPDQFYFAKFHPEVQAFLGAEAEALDAIQDAFLACTGEKLEREVMMQLPAVTACLARFR
jgi:hypothetical protein